MAHKTSLLSGIAVGAVVAASAWYGGTHLNITHFVGAAEAAAPAVGIQPPLVEVFAAQSENVIERDTFSGRFEAVDEVAIQARVSGQLEQVHFQSGQIVQQGDLLFSIDARPFKASLAEAQGRLAEAEAAAELAQSEFERATQLSAQGHISQSVLDTRQQDAAIAAASIASAQAAVERAQLDLEFTLIHAPVTGRISDDFVSAGNLVAAGAGSTVLTTIVSLDPIHFVFDVTEQQYLEYIDNSDAMDFRSAAPNREVALQLVGNSEFAREGYVNFIDNRLDRGTGTLRGRAVFDNADGILLPGMFGRIEVATGNGQERVVIPDLAIGSDQSTKFVWVVADDGAVQRRDVTLSDRHAGLRIVEGLEPGEQVIVSGLHMVSAGAQVRVRPDQSETTDLAMR